VGGGSPTQPDSGSGLAESADGTTIPTAMQIIDSHSDVWTLVTNPNASIGVQIARNGTVDTPTNQVTLLLYFNHVVSQQAHNLWWSWVGGAWLEIGGDPRGSSTPTAAGIGYMIGYGGGAETDAQVAQFEAILGRPMDIGTDTISLESWQFGPFTSSNGRKLAKVLIFPMLSESFDSNQGLQDLGAAASGAYDNIYTQMAQSIASFGSPAISVRIGHEMNGNWYPWSATDGNGHNATPASYIATFKRIAKIVRQYNPNVLIEWCTSIQPTTPSWPGSSKTPLDYWVGAYDPVTNPGGADVISMDWYEGMVGSNFDANIRGGQFGLDWLVSFAQQNGVKVALSEVSTGLMSSQNEGDGCPCSNDGSFMQKLVDWLNGLPPGMLTHFCFSPWAPSDDLLSSGNAAIQQVWKSSWGNTHFAGTWWKGPKVPSQQ
jgi:hypothetical protein